MAGAPDHEAKRVVADIPMDVTTILDRLDIKPSTRGYVCCARCFACDDIDDYPDYCTKVNPEDDKTCGAFLRKIVRRKGTNVVDPVRRYLHHDMKQWMAHFLCRPDLERWLDRKVIDTGPLDQEQQ